MHSLIPSQIPVTEASQQDTVWHCFAVCGLRGFPFDLPDTPHLLLQKNDPLFGSKGLALCAMIWHRMPGLSRSAKKKAEAFASTFSFPLYFSFFPKTGM